MIQFPLTESTERVKGTRKTLNVIIVLINKEQKPPHSEHFIKRHSSFVVVLKSAHAA